ncbi:MAG: NAD-dependent epimerase/dehydratase family protein [Nitrospira sp.]
MRIFIAGATGVIGRRVVPLLMATGHQVTAVGRTPEKCVALERMGAAALQIDLFNSAVVRQAVADHDAVINLTTSIPTFSRVFFRGAWRENDRIRRIVSANLAEAAKTIGIPRLIQESFAPAYPDSGDDWVEEQTALQPVRYNQSLLDAEAAAMRFIGYGGAGVILRFAFFYGADSGFTRDACQYIRRGWAPVFGSTTAFMSSISHDDAATAVVAALNAGSGVYNVADDEPVRRREYAESLASVLGVAPPKFPPAFLARLFGSLGKMLSRSIRVSNRKLRAETGWKPMYPSVREGWRAIVKTFTT